MPTNYTANGFLMVRLHPLRARTISVLVTTHERVGRTIKAKASKPEVSKRGTIDLKETTMNTSLNHGSARIYQFPAGGRSALGGRRYGDAKTNIEANSARVSETDCSSSWYHGAAIEEAQQEREH